MKTKKVVGRIFLYLLVVLACFAFLMPILWIVFSSFKTQSELFAWPPKLFSMSPSFDNYRLAFSSGDFGAYFFNTSFVAIVATVITVVINTMAGYVFAKYRFKGDRFLFMMVLATLMIPLEVIMIPIFKVIVATHLYNNLWGLIIPAAASPTAVFLVRQYYLSISSSIMESARIDGASEWRIFTSVMLPIGKPVMAVLTIISFMWRWNDYLWPKIIINNKQKFTIQLALANFSGEYSVDWNSLLAMSVVSMLPVIIVFLIFQKHIVGGMTTGAVKG
jgi:alpha-1,4-digalacturonate transport system permease protein